MEDKVIEMWSDGLSISAIARELGVGEAEVYLIISDNNLL